MPGRSPVRHDGYPSGDTMIDDGQYGPVRLHDPAADVRAAREAVHHTEVRLPPRDPRRPVARRRRRPVIERLRDFVRRYGWRAYAVPILSVVTVVALVHTNSPAPVRQVADRKTGIHPFTQNHLGGTSPTAPPVAPDDIALGTDAPTDAAAKDALEAAALPPGQPYTKHGDGTFRTLSGTTKIVGASGHLYRYSIDVENGITGIGLDQFATMVDTTLADPRSWSGHGVRLKRVDSGHVDFHITLTSSFTVRKFCGYTIPVETSCYAPAGTAAGVTVNRVVLNDARWMRGAMAYVGDLDAYRTYMINHEDGHALGHEHAHQCLPGGLAPVMMQQTFGLVSARNHELCGANPWPYPPGAKGAPGAEQPDTAKNDEYPLAD